MELIDRIKKDIDDRLEELRPQVEEIPRLEAVLAALQSSGGHEGARTSEETSPGGRGRGRPRGAGARRGGAGAGRTGGPRRRARRGQRREELLALVAAQPEITIAEAARRMGVSSPQVSTLVRRLEEEGVLARSDGRFEVVSSNAVASEGPQAGAGENPTASDGDAIPSAGETEGASSDGDVGIDGPGVESLAGGEGDQAGDDPVLDESGRPQAT
jgi:hypothetical protein